MSALPEEMPILAEHSRAAAGKAGKALFEFC
jgi:hypothetical protein